MPIYHPQNFQSIFDTPFGRDLWKFLNLHDNVIRLQTASELRRPALEALATRIKAKFKITRDDHRKKQLAGHMTRQIMEANGFVHEAKHVRVRFGDLFNLASRYKKKV